VQIETFFYASKSDTLIDKLVIAFNICFSILLLLKPHSVVELLQDELIKGNASASHFTPHKWTLL